MINSGNRMAPAIGSASESRLVNYFLSHSAMGNMSLAATIIAPGLFISFCFPQTSQHGEWRSHLPTSRQAPSPSAMAFLSLSKIQPELFRQPMERLGQKH